MALYFVRERHPDPIHTPTAPSPVINLPSWQPTFVKDSVFMKLSSRFQFNLQSIRVPGPEKILMNRFSKSAAN
jgi:hypothetical protein